MSVLSEQSVQDSFHSYLKSSLTQAKAERLIDAELLSSAEGDLMITGPALCLFFAALRCTTSPPSVPLPRIDKTAAPMELSVDNCPPVFQSFLRVWSRQVEPIQSLVPEHQHDLARVICGLPPISDPPENIVLGIAQDLRAVAIEISQRRSFQDRYSSDLQAALDAGNAFSQPAKKASFVPPPAYEPSPTSSAHTSPQPSVRDLPPQSPTHLSPYSPPPTSSSTPSSPNAIPHQRHTRTTSQPSNPPSQPPSGHSRSQSQSASSSPAPPSPSSSNRRSPSPSILSPMVSRATDLIRETLYASLADVLESQPTIRDMLQRDPAKAYFSCVSFAILHVALNCVTPSGAIMGVLGTEVTMEMCPPQLQPLMKELVIIGTMAKSLQEEDDRAAVQYARSQAVRPNQSRSSQDELPPIPLMDRVHRMLVEGVGCDSPGTGSSGRKLQGDGGRRRSIEGRAVAFSNRVNGLSLLLTKLPAFRHKQDFVFQILSGIGR